MVIRYLPRSSSVRTAVLAIGALALLSTPVAAAEVPAEPAPPRPLPAYSSTLLDRPGVQVRPGPGAPSVPANVSALSWLVADARTGEVLAARNAHRPLPPASTLKSLFALTALPRLDADEKHLVTEHELDRVGEGSSMVGVAPGRRYRVADLWRGVFLSSGNDAVHVLAGLNGGWHRSVEQMRAKARELGANDTHVVSPDGYDAAGQVSSAYDLAVFGKAGLADPEFARYCSTRVAPFPAGGWSYPIQNTNRLLTGADGVAPYPGLLGVKNGYTSNAGSTLISAARRDGRTLVVTVMNPQAGGGYAVYEEARSLLDWGFAAAGHVRPVGSLLPPAKTAGTAPGPAHAATAAQAAQAVVGTPDEDSDWPAVLLVGAGALAVLGGAVVAVRRRATVARRADAGAELAE
ncbi:D-alanyl-D-alanine carboxypeptidase family protein [Streptomyces kanamyceticus]|uniref:D-alanyl-D-alanine carboxypeptidase n=1 Tax=Streptomyces kanamyceticus TaxID=1967 RepID=A0A5J6G799_STRKN|nr:serine hydrolase [Streptomyces kanamyceticus]QEU89651.1 D-alanyl-D-alanine carboxypeptidase [Streptomyces kanamyceticus]